MSASADDMRGGREILGPSATQRFSLPAGAVIAALAGLVGGWTAAGSAGVFGHPLRRGLACTAILCAVIVAWPKCGKPLVRLFTLAAALVIAVSMMASMLPPVNALAVALVLLALAEGQSGAAKKTLRLAAEAVILLALYRFACTSIPLVWQSADSVGGVLGRMAGFLTFRPFRVGATFAGMDFLVTMLYLAVAAPLRSDRPPGNGPSPHKYIFLAVSAVLVGQLIYLLVLSLAARAIPWNLPAVAMAIQVLVAWLIFRRLTSFVEEPSRGAGEVRRPRWVGWAVTAGAGLLASLLPVLTTLCWNPPELSNKKIVMYEKCYGNWQKPRHGDYGHLAIGMYGTLPTYLESLGARSLISSDLSQQDLNDAQALILLYPNEPWTEGQLERIWAFVRRGGKLLVMGEHTVREEDGGSRVNEVLAPTAIRVRFDSAMFAIGGWLHSYEALSHPTSAGISDEQNQFGVVVGASLQAHWPARPLLIGRWGWADHGDESSGPGMMGNRRYDPGEKLGDLVLAAEQRVGNGKVIVFGDTSGLTNGLTITCHQYTSRLLAYLGDDSSAPQPLWRQLIGLAVVLVLLTMLIWRPDPGRAAAVSVILAGSLVVCTKVTHRAWEVLPDGNLKSPNNLAYIDGSHAEAFSRESWREDGARGLAMTLMRNGYLTLMLPELTPERLAHARLLISIAPTRYFSNDERQAVRDFVRAGGIFICTVGYEHRAASRLLLSEFGFHVVSNPGGRAEPDGEPYPLGHFKAPFFDGGDYFAYVRFHAAWPVQCDDPNALVISHHPPNLPVIIVRRYGRGLVALIGDSCFAMNKNLEREDGSPFEGMRENADFWRWFLALLGEGEPWYPPKPASAAAADAAQHPDEDANREEAP